LHPLPLVKGIDVRADAQPWGHAALTDGTNTVPVARYSADRVCPECRYIACAPSCASRATARPEATKAEAPKREGQRFAVGQDVRATDAAKEYDYGLVAGKVYRIASVSIDGMLGLVGEVAGTSWNARFFEPIALATPEPAHHGGERAPEPQAGALFGIDAQTYPEWRTRVYARLIAWHDPSLKGTP